jgi:hypothetical protein
LKLGNPDIDERQVFVLAPNAVVPGHSIPQLVPGAPPSACCGSLDAEAARGKWERNTL